MQPPTEIGSFPGAQAQTDGDGDDTIGDRNGDVTIRNHTTSRDTEFSFNCLVEARPPPQITWYHNGVRLHENNPRFTFSSNKETLTVAHVTDDDGGEWKCIAENKAGSHSINFSLDVLVAPTIFTRTKEKKLIPILISKEEIQTVTALSDTSGNQGRLGQGPSRTVPDSGMSGQSLDLSERVEL